MCIRDSLLPVPHVLILEELRGGWHEPGGARRAAVLDVTLEELDLALRFRVLLLTDGNDGPVVANLAAVPGVDAEDVVGDGEVPLVQPLVPHDEDEVETGKDGGLKVDVLLRRLEVVVTALYNSGEITLSQAGTARWGA